MNFLENEVKEILLKDGGWMSFSAIFNRCEDGITSEQVHKVVDAMIRAGTMQKIHGALGIEYALAGKAVPSDYRAPSQAIQIDPAEVSVDFPKPKEKQVHWRDPADQKKIAVVSSKSAGAQAISAPVSKVSVVASTVDRKHHGPNGHTPDFILAMLEHETDVTPDKVAAKLKISKTTAIYHLRKLGLLPAATPKTYFNKSVRIDKAEAEKVADNLVSEVIGLASQDEAIPSAAATATARALPPASFALWDTGELRIEFDEKNWVVLDADETKGLVAFLVRTNALKVVAA